MAEFIDKQEVLDILRGKGAPWDAYAKVQSLPAADVRPVVWIPVTERLPENGKDVLVWVSIGKAPIVAYDVDCYNERAKRWVCFENDVTHWMPLPEPPKEES